MVCWSHMMGQMKCYDWSAWVMCSFCAQDVGNIPEETWQTLSEQTLGCGWRMPIPHLFPISASSPCISSPRRMGGRLLGDSRTSQVRIFTVLTAYSLLNSLRGSGPLLRVTASTQPVFADLHSPFNPFSARRNRSC